MTKKHKISENRSKAKFSASTHENLAHENFYP